MASILRYFNELRTWSVIAIADVFSDTQSANQIFAGPTSGAAAAPAFRPLVAADLPITATNKADQQAGTSNTEYVTPLHQQDHDSAIKVWVSFTGSTGAIQGASYNVTSVTRNGAGDYTINFTTNFTDANYVCLATQEQTAGAQGYMSVVKNAGRAASSVRVLNYNSVFALVDPTSLFVTCFGRQ